MPEISIIIPAYQEQQAIGRVVEEVRRVLEQAGKDFEIIVVNDGSSDQTAAEAKKLGPRSFPIPTISATEQL